VHGQRCEHDSVTSSENLMIPLERERAENGNTHSSTLDLARQAVNAGDTAVIPNPTAAIPPGLTTGTSGVRRMWITGSAIPPNARTGGRTMSAQSRKKIMFGTIAVVPLAFAAVMVAASEASADPRQPVAAYQDPFVPDDWPDEGTGYPGYADQSSSTGIATSQGSGLDTTSVALGVLGGIAFSGAGLGISLAVQRRRDHVTA
jgi:hypothetical protein